MRDLKQLSEFKVENPLQDAMLKILACVSSDEANDLVPQTYLIPGDKVDYWVLVSSSLGWDHVSVSIRAKDGTPVARCPRWDEMCFIKEKFFEDTEYVCQYHPSKNQYVNNHPYVLHLWRPTDVPLPVPPSFMV